MINTSSPKKKKKKGGPTAKQERFSTIQRGTGGEFIFKQK